MQHAAALAQRPHRPAVQGDAADTVAEGHRARHAAPTAVDPQDRLVVGAGHPRALEVARHPGRGRVERRGAHQPVRLDVDVAHAVAREAQPGPAASGGQRQEEPRDHRAGAHHQARDDEPDRDGPPAKRPAPRAGTLRLGAVHRNDVEEPPRLVEPLRHEPPARLERDAGQRPCEVADGLGGEDLAAGRPRADPRRARHRRPVRAPVALEHVAGMQADPGAHRPGRAGSRARSSPRCAPSRRSP